MLIPGVPSSEATNNDSGDHPVATVQEVEELRQSCHRLFVQNQQLTRTLSEAKSKLTAAAYLSVALFSFLLLLLYVLIFT